jgi:hypothetical protein
MQPVVHKAEFDKLVAAALTDTGQCRKCHDVDRTRPPTVPPDLLRPQIPTIWLPGAKFNHSAHRAVSCGECHTKPTPLDPTRKLDEREPLNLPAITKCQECHASASGSNDDSRGGARHDCVECHRYHNAERPNSRPADGKLDRTKFLMGLPP